MNNQGWIKLYRTLLKWKWHDDPNTAWLFMTCLMLANHEQAKWHGIYIQKGSCLTSHPILKQQTGLTLQQLRTSLGKLKSTGEITVKTTNKYSIITICNYSQYQSNNKQLNTQTTGKNVGILMRQNLENEAKSMNLTNVKKATGKSTVKKQPQFSFDKIIKSTDNLTLKQQASNSQATTNNNDKNEKNITNINISKQLNTIIPLFETINPSYKRIYSNKTERTSLERLIKQYGRERVISMLKKLPEIMKIPYAPSITTPYELEMKMGKLKIFLQQEGIKNNKYKVGEI